jgi:predicted polyphosphate/ATP-dependent NAD kinase
MDIDEEAFRRGRVSARLFGHMLVPFEVDLMQPTKISSPTTSEEKERQLAIARYIAENMEPDTVYILGSGTTVSTIAEVLKVRKALLGVDLVQNGRLLGFDVNERQILSRIEGEKAKVIVTPIGGQGFIFGRGNQQISPAVLRAVGKENVIVVATSSKLEGLRKLRVDTGDPEVDRWFKGPIRVVVGYGEEQVMMVE